MADPLDTDADTVPPVLRHQLVLVDGRTFAISDEGGQMWAPTHGLVHDDLRHLSRLDASLDEGPIEVLASTAPTPLSAVIVGRVHDDHHSGQPGVVTDQAMGRRRTAPGRSPPEPVGGRAPVDAPDRPGGRLRPCVRREGGPARSRAAPRCRRGSVDDRTLWCPRRRSPGSRPGPAPTAPTRPRALWCGTWWCPPLGADRVPDRRTGRRRRGRRPGLPLRHRPGRGRPDAPAESVAGRGARR